MHRRYSGAPLRLVRASSLARYVRYLQLIGAPVGRLLERSGIPAMLLHHPEAVLPLETALRFLEIACRSVGTQQLGLEVALELRWKGLGAYGQMLQRARTLHQYLREGIAAYDGLITGQRVWLTEHGEELRFHVANANPPGIATYQAEVETLVVTIMKCRETAGPGWSPREIHLGYRTAEPLPDVEPLDGSRILRGGGETYFTIPRNLSAQRLRCGARLPIPASDPASPAGRTLPTGLRDTVQLQIENLLLLRAHHVDTVAETLSMSRRTLQRLLADQGLSYSRLLAEARLHRAVDWLENTDKPVGEIAFDLGYSDASNFTRAFRRQIGLSPKAFRDAREKVVPLDR